MILFNRSASTKTEGFLTAIGTDIHSHLIPGIDDGVQDSTTGARFIKQLNAWGIQQVITTPHIKPEQHENSPVTITPAYERLLQAMKNADLDVPVSFAAEYYIDETFTQRLQQPLLTLKDNLLLVEISFAWAPAPLYEWMFDILSAGYQPLLAHPERYGYMHGDMRQYEILKEKGVQLQLNLLSLSGYYGKSVQKAAQQLIDAKLIDYVGTDLHHDRHLEALEEMGKQKKFVRLLETYGFKNSLLQA